jgi:hypothetical protein
MNFVDLGVKHEGFGEVGLPSQKTQENKNDEKSCALFLYKINSVNVSQIKRRAVNIHRTFKKSGSY